MARFRGVWLMGKMPMPRYGATTQPARQYVRGNGSYVDCYSCDDGAGTTADTSAGIKVWLPRNGLQKDPNIREDAIFPVALGPDGEYFCTGDYLDEEIGAWKIWHSTTPPPGWALADGTGETQNSKSRFLVGCDSGNADHDGVGETGGADTHTHAGHDNHANHGNHADHSDPSPNRAQSALKPDPKSPWSGTPVKGLVRSMARSGSSCAADRGA